MLRIVFSIGAAFAAVITTNVFAGDKFSLTVTPGTFYGRYDRSLYRDLIQGNNFFIEGQYKTHWGFSAAYEYTRIKYKYSIPDFTQKAGYLSGHVSYLPAGTRGSYTFRLDFHSVSDNDNTLSGDDVQVVASQISYERIDHSFYLDLGYALSRYEQNAFTPGALQVQQWTPTLGIALTHGAANWVKLRGYIIYSSNPLRSQYVKNTSALEMKYLYYPLSPYKLIPKTIELTALTGYRIYAVDRDTASVANLAEMEKGGISIAVTWRLTKSVSFLYSQGLNKFRELVGSRFNDYTENTAWLGLTARW